MKPSDRNASTPVGQIHGDDAPPGKVETGLLQCLVSSASQTRRNVLTRAASEAGWESVVCSTPNLALGVVERDAFQFAMVDLDDRGKTPSGARELVQTLVKHPDRMLVGVCGHEADPEEEIWVRQLGIWLYLPGLTTASEVALLCEQAIQLVTRQQSDRKRAPKP